MSVGSKDPENNSHHSAHPFPAGDRRQIPSGRLQSANFIFASGEGFFFVAMKKKNCHLSISEIAVRMENLANCPKESSRIPEWSCHLL